MPSWLAIGVSSGPKMISAGAPSRTAPKTIIISTESSRNIRLPYWCAKAIIVAETCCGICSMVSANDRLVAAATMKRMPPAIDAERTKSSASARTLSSRNARLPTTSA